MSDKNGKPSQRAILIDHEQRIAKLEKDLESVSDNLMKTIDMLGCMIDFVDADKFREFRRNWVAKKKGEESLAEERGALEAGIIVEVESFEVDGIASIREDGPDGKPRSYRGMIVGMNESAKPLLGLKIGETAEVDGPDGKHVVTILATYKPVRAGGQAQA